VAGVHFYEITNHFIINHNKDISHCNVGNTEVISTALKDPVPDLTAVFFKMLDFKA
jgi:hypothetical protein